MPKLSIIIPTLNRGRVFAETIAQLRRQRLTDFELVVVDQSDEPLRKENETFIREMADPRIHYLHVERKNLPNARDEGLARVTGEIVLFLDDDVILLDPDFLDAHVEAYLDPLVGGVTGRTIERSLRSNSPQTAMHVTWGGRTVINLTGTDRRFIAGMKGANMSFRASLFPQIGGFDRNFVGSAILEDVDFSFRATAAGWRLAFEPRAEMLHLSAPQGGVRITDRIARECWRFQLTCYFVRKHRGLLGLVPFAVTFGLIAMLRIMQWRRPSAAMPLWAAIQRGLASFRQGPDQALVRGPLSNGLSIPHPQALVGGVSAPS